jgi:putative acetyltransferase
VSDHAPITVRREGPGDRIAVEAVHRAAFPDDGRYELAVLRGLWDGPWFLPRLSLVADSGGDAIGHLIATRAHVGEADALGVGPVGVTPARHGRGVGSALVNALVGAAQALDETVLVLLGDPRFYGRFGFVPAAELGIEAPDPAWGAHFQAMALADSAPRGRFRYAPPFGV